MSNDHENRITALEKASDLAKAERTSLAQDVLEIKTRLSTLEESAVPKDVEGMSNYILGIALEEQYKKALRNRTIPRVNTNGTR